MDFAAEGLEPSAEALRELIRLGGERAISHIADLANQRASDLDASGDVAGLVDEPMPELPAPFEGMLDLLFEKLARKGVNSASPGALSYIIGGGLPHAAVADLIAGIVNPYVGYWEPSPGFAQLEQTVIRWFCDMLSLPLTSGGVLLSGGSMANLSALVAARAARLGDDFRPGTLYVSDQAHHSVAKAALLAGFPRDAVRTIPTSGDNRIHLDELVARILRDRDDGRRPFMVVGTAGTTNTGAVDDLDALADISASHGLWFHIDAAYGGFFAMTARGRAALAGIERADSVVLDPHKSLFLPFGTGCLLARDVTTLTASHTLHSDYILAAVEGSSSSAVNFADASAEMTRASRGLRLWLPFKLLGAEVFRRALDEKLDLARWAADRLGTVPGFEIVAAPELSIFAFRVTLPGLEPDALDDLNRRVLDRVNAKGRVHLSATQLRGRFTLRICVLSFRTHEGTVRACVDDLVEAFHLERDAGPVRS